MPVDHHRLVLPNRAGVHQVVLNARRSGGKELRPVQDQFYGDRSGMLEDPFGHVWNIATHKEDLTQEEIEKRMESMQGQNG